MGFPSRSSAVGAAASGAKPPGAHEPSHDCESTLDAAGAIVTRRKSPEPSCA